MDGTKKDYRNAFQYLYGEFCNNLNCPVLYRVNVHVHMGVLDFCGDGFKSSDWKPLLRALRMDRSLHYIAIRSKASSRPYTSSNGSAKMSLDMNGAIPQPVLAKIPQSLRDCLSVNSNLTTLELDGLLFPTDSLQVLASGLSKSISLKCLSLRRCRTGDDGCKVICVSLRNHPSITSIDLSACDLSERGAIYVARLLQYQNLNRYSENWKQSLRYRQPDTEAMPGLRRVTLSHNNIGDRGTHSIIQVLYDDRWIKAIDLQSCQLTEESGQNILKLFRINDTISIMDVRNNKLMMPNTMAAIILQLNNRQTQFEWHPDDPTCLPRTTSETTVKLTGVRRPNRVRKTISNIFPSQTVGAKQLRKSISTPHANHRRCTNIQKALSDTGSTSQVEALQKHLEQLTQQLEEEIARRKEAEATRDRAQSRLESHLRELATKRAADGTPIDDGSVLKQVSSAVSGLNQCYEMIKRAALSQHLFLPKTSLQQESWDRSISSETKCYDDLMSTETSEAQTAFSQQYSPPLAGQGDAFSKEEIFRSISSTRTSEDDSTLKNLCSDEEETRRGSISEESTTSWTTMASRSSLRALRL